MTQPPLTTPVLFAIFNRPDVTAITFARIAEAKPQQLYIIADGPRADHPTDAEKCAATRAVVERIDWECDVHRNYSAVNVGPGWQLARGIDWFFAQVESGMILEDDILPDPTFFRFAQEMLARYRDDGRVLHVTGRCSVLPTRMPQNYPYSYYFSHYGSTWGWATWRRAWQSYFDMEMKLWTPELKAELRKHQGLNQTVINNFEAAHKWKIPAWDYRWQFARLVHSGLSIVSARNLIHNIGFGVTATNTHNPYIRSAATTSASLDFPLRHPPTVMPWPSYERAAQRASQGFHWRNQLLKHGPQWLMRLGQRGVRWLERQQMRRRQK